MMRRMYGDYGKTGKLYTIDDVIQIASEEADKGLSPFFDRYVKGTQVIQIKAFLP